MMTRFIILAAILLCLEGCQRPDDSLTKVGPIATLRHIAEGYAYTAFINGEPVNWAYSPADTMVRSYPLKQGTNQLEEIVEFPSPTTKYEIPPSKLKYEGQQIWMKVEVQDVKNRPATPIDWILADHLSKWGPFTNPYVWNTTFKIENQVKDSDLVFQELGKDKESFTSVCRTLAVRLARIVAERNDDHLARVLGFHDVRSAQSSTPNWFIKKEIGDLSVTSVTDETEVMAVTGKHLILIHSMPGKHLTSFLVKNGKGAAYIDSFAFGRIDGHWAVYGSSGVWMKLNLGD